MELIPVRKSWLNRPLLLLAAGLAAVALGLRGPDAAAREQWTAGTVLASRITPFSESVAQMARRDLARRATVLAENIPPSAIANPREPWEGHEERERQEQERERRGERSVEGLFLPASGATPQTLGTNFSGIGMQDQINRFSGWTYPPDSTGAVGPSHFVQVINGSMAVYDKSTGALIRHVSLNTFLAYNDGSGNYPRNGAFDPRLLFDWRSRRWFICALELGPTTPVGAGSQNHLLLAVSRTSDPNDTFDKYLLPVGVDTVRSGGNTIASFTDYCTLGVDANGVYAGVRIFPYNANTGELRETYAKIVATPIAPLLADTPSMGTVKQFSGIEDVFSTPQPALNLDAVSGSSPAWFVGTSPSSSSLVHRKLVWSGGNPSLSNNSVVLTTPAAALQLLDAPASGSTGGSALNTGDARLQSATIHNGRLWTCRTIAVNAAGTSSGTDRTACEWFEIDVSTSNPSLVQNGRVFDSAASDPRFYYFPSIMVSGQGHAVLACSGARSTEFVGCYYTGRLATDPLGTMGDPVLLRAGNARYVQFDFNNPPRNRWGDYSYTTLDPADDMSLWTIQEYAENPGAPVGSDQVTSRWGIRVGRLLAPPPALNSSDLPIVQRNQTGVSLTYVGSALYDPGPGFTNRLQAQITGGSPSGISNVSVTYNGPNSVTVHFDVAANAGGGVRALTLTNPDGQSVTLDEAFSVGQPAVLQFSAGTYSIPESGGPATVTVTRTGATAEPAAVEYTTAGGTASTGSDYEATSGVLEFAAGETSKTFDVTINPDALLEGDETVLLSLSNPVDGTLGTNSSARLTLVDDLAAPAPTGLSAVVTSAAVNLAWTNHCGNPQGFQVERKAGSGSFVLITTTGPSSNTAADTGPLTPGTLYTYRVRCFNGALASNYSNTAAITVTTVQFAAATSTVNEASNAASITVTRAGILTGSLSVPVALGSGTATTGTDFTEPAGTVEFAPGEASRSIVVPIQTDALLEGDETVVLLLGDPGIPGTVLGSTATHTLTLADDLQGIAPTTLRAAVTGAAEITLSWVDRCANEDGFQVERKSGSAAFALVGTTPPDAVSFVDGDRSRGVAYTYRVRAIRGPVASDYSNTATAAIDGVQFSAANYTASEANGATTITVTRVGNTTTPATVHYATADGTAVAGEDYTPASGTLTFAPGELTKNFNVLLTGDSQIEGSETVSLLLSDASGIEVGTPGAATLTIADNISATRPANLTATVRAAARIQLAWEDHSDNETGFRVERAAGSTVFNPVGTTGPNATSFDDTGLARDTTYVYRVVAFNDVGQSAPSNLTSASIPSGGKIQLKPAKLNFGTVRVGKSKQLKLKIKNVGSGTLAGYLGAPAGPFTFLGGAGPFSLAPKSTLTVILRYDPTAAETNNAVLPITSTDSARFAIDVPVKARGK